jgi:hypothetical protein
MIKPLTYFLLVNSIQAFLQIEPKEGPCSLAAGERKHEKFDANLLKGQWMNMYDRKELNEHFKCYGVDFDQLTPDDEENKETVIRSQKFFEFNQHVMPIHQPEDGENTVPHFKVI